MGEKHQDVLDAQRGLANLYRDQERFLESENLYGQLLLDYGELPNSENDIAITLNNMGLLFLKKSEHEKAEEHFRRAIEIWKKLFGNTHFYVGNGLKNLAMAYAVRKDNKTAKNLYLEALEYLENGLGSTHRWTVDCREKLEQL
ncbi:MAG: tetratricopeptide repeat protein [Leptolyngbya sp. SIOISBB]|nr:tetratricopeptide repeat protein [Leptolyngbya sp. SIOISBB]